MPYKIQKAGPETASCIFYHSSKEAAQKEIEDELPRILMVTREALSDLIASGGYGANLLGDIEMVLIEAGDALKLKEPWEAYRHWREFADFWAQQGVPVADWFGELIIEDSKSEDAFYFYPEPPKKPIKERPSLGAFQSWKVYQGDFVFPNKHPYVTTSEEAAKHKVANILWNWTMDALKHQIEVWEYVGPRQNNEHAEFVKEARKLIKEMADDLNGNRVWTAYHRLKLFEEKFENEFSDFGLVGTIGSLKVVPEPEPEEAN
jgi:hypothetical protein